MNRPTIAIVGRPNVGKSSYMNAAARRRISIVQETPGVTRDRVTCEVEVLGQMVELVDTGGIGVVDEARLDAHIERQIDTALETADAVIFLVDGKDGITALDTRVAEILRRLRKPMILGVNKLDHPKHEPEASEFYSLGMGEPRAISAQEYIGVDALLEEIVRDLQKTMSFDSDDDEDDTLKIAFVGKRNVGKSTVLNLLAEEERVIVSDIAGTTRDAVDQLIELKGRKFIAIDTAGIMKKSSISNSIEFYSQSRTEQAIRRADVVLFLLDAAKDISQVDKKLASIIVDEAKPCVVVVNKWDLAKDTIETGDYMKYLEVKLHGLHFAPVVFSSALENFNVVGAISTAFDLHEQAQTRVGTGELNRLLEGAMRRRRPGGAKGYKARIYYGTQVGVSPPSFSIFVNDMKLFPANYGRYIINQLREEFDFEEIPVRLFFKRRKSLYHS